PDGEWRRGFEETVRRANAYLDAGAGEAFVIGARDGELIARLAAAIHGPLNILAGPGTPPRCPSLPEWASNGSRSAPTSPRRRSRSCAARPRNFPVPVRTAFAEGTFTQPEVHRILRGK